MSHEPFVTAGAVGAVISPWWLPSLHKLSIVAAEFAPILGASWLILQIVVKLYEMYRKYKDNDVRTRL